MTTRGSWSVKGIDPKARAVARDRAQREGVTLGVYLNRLLLEDVGGPGAPIDIGLPIGDGDVEELGQVTRALDDLARRFEAAEKRSASALSGVDQSLMGLVGRIEAAEQGSRETLSAFSKNLDGLKKAQATLQSRLGKSEGDDTSKRALDAMRDLEGALSRLVAQIHERQHSADARQAELTADVEANLSRVDDDVALLSSRLGASDDKLNQALAQMTDAADAVERNKDLADKLFGRVDQLETNLQSSHANVASMMGAVSDASSRLEQIESRTSNLSGDLESTVDRINDRLVRAEQSTEAAIRSLENSFTSVDSRLAEMQRKVSETSDLRETFQRRFDGLTEDLARALADTRAEMNQRIDDAVRNGRPEAVEKLGQSVGHLQDKLVESEERQARVVEAVGAQLNRMSVALDTRLKTIEARDDGVTLDMLREEIDAFSMEMETRIQDSEQQAADAIESAGEEVGRIADKLEARVRDGEQQTAEAIGAVGDQVSRVAERLEARQEDALKHVTSALDEADAKSDNRLQTAIADVARRFDEIADTAEGAVEPLRSTVASIAKRVEMLEDGGAPPPYDEPPFDDEADLADAPDADPLDDAVYLDDADEDDAAAAMSAAVASFDELAEELAPEFDSGDIVKGDEDDGFDALDDLLNEDLGDDPYEDADVDTDSEQTAQDVDALDPLEDAELKDDTAALSKAFAERDNDADDASDDLFGADADPDLDESLDSDLDDAADTPLRSDRGRDGDPFADVATGEAPKAVGPDYLAAARRAALNSSNERREAAAAATPRRKGKLPIMAASALAIAVAGGAAVTYMRGKQDTSSDVFALADAPTEDAVAGDGADAGALNASDADLFEGGAENALFDEAETAAPADDLSADEAASASDPDDLAAAAFEPIEPAQLTRPASIEDAAAAGDLEAIYELALRDLASGEKTRGADQLRRAANRGLTIAQYRLAKLYERGEGVPRSVKESRQWTEQAASAGNVKAMHDLAVFYAEGDGGPQSYPAAASWFLKAAAAGLVDSQYNVGVLYEQGLGVSEDLAEAAYWYEVAGLAGDPDGARRALELSRGAPGVDYDAVRARAAAFAPTPADDRANGRFGAPAWELANADEIRTIQTLLAELGFDPGPADGVAGAGTRRAIREFERRADLEPSGRIRPALIEELRRAVAARG